jgi:probable rRNA maturation factor
LDSRRKFFHGYPLPPVLVDGIPVFQPLSVDIVFVADTEMHELNLNFRGKDKPTDVLSFSQLEGTEEQERAEIILPFCLPLGDIVISLDTAARQANDNGLSLPEEILRLLIHSSLHLFGFEHEGVPECKAEEMEAEEVRIFDAFVREASCLVKEGP